jgi:hypothetical protein
VAIDEEQVKEIKAVLIALAGSVVTIEGLLAQLVYADRARAEEEERIRAQLDKAHEQIGHLLGLLGDMTR